MEVREIGHDSCEYLVALELRRQILRRPLGLDFTADQITAEAADFHIAAMEGIELVGCLVLSPQDETTIKMRQVAVTPDRQGQGIGARMVIYSEEFARAKGFKVMTLNARDTAVHFYLRLGYEVVGEPFEEVTIPHRKMQKGLD
ncbi:MAG: hypothetical protein BGO01_05205 [Armatimonadetes bacterium 55-13]|nr:GNAT family N-acetyltransferase [Armatimonadota bacterium]ODU53912.1 MAG: hypothetical protein ABT09_00775 [bacterium SCN 57-13]OJU61483.1 MAG: hypothetical protein BGO01_05205 [Armatimonadetes bacterium 55-13]